MPVLTLINCMLARSLIYRLKLHNGGGAVVEAASGAVLEAVIEDHMDIMEGHITLIPIIPLIHIPLIHINDHLNGCPFKSGHLFL